MDSERAEDLRPGRARRGSALRFGTDPCGTGIFAVRRDAPGLSVEPLSTVDQTRRQGRVTLSGTPARLIGDPGAGDRHEAALDRAAVALIAEQAGGAMRVTEMATDYARTRYQFGRAIGSFQAVKHLCVDMLLESRSALSAARHVAAGFDDSPSTPPIRASDTVDPDRAADLALAQAFCSEAYVFAAATNIQVHGGIGFTWEHPAHLYLRRARTDANFRRRSLAPGTLRRTAGRAHERRRRSPAGRGPDVAGRKLGPIDQPCRMGQAGLPGGWAVPSWEPQWWGRGLTDAQSRIVATEFAAIGAKGRRPDRSDLMACTACPRHRRAETPADPAVGARRDPAGACSTASRAPVLTWPGCGPARTRRLREATGWSTARRSGPPSPPPPTTRAAGCPNRLGRAQTPGLSFFIFPMRQPGVEIRPIHQITGESEFNEVFITDARCRTPTWWANPAAAGPCCNWHWPTNAG